MIQVSWTQMKSFISNKSLYLQWYEDDVNYYLYASDASLIFSLALPKDTSTDTVDFETNYKNATSTNKPNRQLDTDGAAIVRTKAAKSGWSYAAIPLEFETSRRSNYLYSKLVDGTDRSGITLKIYDANDAEITTDGLLNANLATAVKTVIDFEPAYDYEVIGGSIRSETTVSEDVRLWIIAVPDIPAGSGGSKEMAGGINLKFLTPDVVYEVDGRVSKFLQYSAIYHTNKIRLILKYPAGTNEKFMITMEVYRA